VRYDENGRPVEGFEGVYKEAVEETYIDIVLLVWTSLRVCHLD
jgi:hypothetical protein